jgi:hypothetical protein
MAIVWRDRVAYIESFSSLYGGHTSPLISGRGRECTGWMKFVLLTQVDGRLRVWKPRNTAFLQEHIVCTTAFGGAGVTVWGCFSLNFRIDRLVNGWQSKWGTTNGHRVWSRYFCPVKVPSRTYKSSLQFREKHPQTVTPAHCKHAAKPIDCQQAH